MAEDEEVYLVQKKEYDTAVTHMETEKDTIVKDMGQSFQEYKESESKFHQNNVQSDIFETFQRRIQRESQYMTKPESRLLPEVKTFQEYFNIKLKQQEDIMKVLREHQRDIKDNAENFSRQMKLFKDLRALLETKQRTGATGGDGLVGYQDTQARGFDRLVVRD